MFVTIYGWAPCHKTEGSATTLQHLSVTKQVAGRITICARITLSLSIQTVIRQNNSGLRDFVGSFLNANDIGPIERHTHVTATTLFFIIYCIWVT